MYCRGGKSAVRHVGCITCVGEWDRPKYGTPTVAAAICRQPALWAGTVVHLYLYRPTQKRLLLYWVVPFNQTGYIRHGASPWRGWMALGQRCYIWFRISGRTIQPHRLYMPRGGRQVADGIMV